MRFFRPLIMVLLLWSMSHLVSAQPLRTDGDGRLQIFEGRISDRNIDYINLFDLRAGQKLFVYTEVLEGDLDTYLELGDVAFTISYASDDDSGPGTDAQLIHEITGDGDYTLAITSYDATTSGRYRLILGLDAPDALDGSLRPRGEPFAVAFIPDRGLTRPEDAPEQQGVIQHFQGRVSNRSLNYYDLRGLRAGQTLFLSAAALSGDLDTYIAVGDIDFESVLAFDDDSGPDTDSRLIFPVPADGDYSVLVTSSDETTSGTYELWLGVDAPDALDGAVVPRGTPIAYPYIDSNPSMAGIPQGPVQQFNGAINGSAQIYALYNLSAGQVFYASAYATGSSLRPRLSLRPAPLGPVQAESSLDDQGRAILQAVIPSDGDYSLIITGADESHGDYMLAMGIDAPGTLDFSAAPAGGEFVLYAGTINDIPTQSGEVQLLNGRIETDSTDRYMLDELKAGQTLDLFAEAISGDLDTLIEIYREGEASPIASDDDSGIGSNSRLSVRIPEDGSYVVHLSSFAQATSGDYRLLVGIDAPLARTGRAAPSSDTLARPYLSAPGAQDFVCTTLTKRPELSGPALTFETEYFVLHYTLEGRDGATPYFIEQVARAVERAWNHHTRILGWPIPPGDCGEGGDSRFDIYVRELISDNVLGTGTRGPVVGDNPNTAQIETNAGYSYLSIDNDFQGVENPLGVMRATIAHEMTHNIQFGLDLNDPYFGIYESTATWMETDTFPADEDASRYVAQVLEYPDVCIGGSPGATGGSTRIYGEWLLLDSLVQDHGPQIITAIWNDLAVNDGIASFYETLARFGTTPQEAVQRMGIRNLLRRYDLSPRFPSRLRVESNINGPGTIEPRRSGVQELSLDYLLITTPDLYTFRIDDPKLHLYLVGIDQPQSLARVHDLGQGGSVDTRAYTYSYLMILNTRVHSDPRACLYTSWRIEVTPGGNDLVPALSERWDASLFVPAG